MTGRDLLPPVQYHFVGVGYSRSTPTAFSLKFMTFIKKQFIPLENKKIRERLHGGVPASDYGNGDVAVSF
jgi:hypothetical protein